MIFGIVISVIFSASNIVRGGIWELPNPSLIDPGLCFAFEVKKNISINDENVEIKLYPGHLGYYSWIRWFGFNTELPEAEPKYDNLVFEIISGKELINFKPIAIDFLSDEFKVITKENSRNITYNAFITTNISVGELDNDSGTIEFYLRMRYADDSKQLNIVGVGFKYKKSSNKITFYY